MDYRLSMRIIEQHVGSKGVAAKEAGVTATTWSRWRSGAIKPDSRSLRILELLVEKYTICK
jgi:DNA-binding transcriptional regulator YiaG